jgi:hypothetical protein
MMDVAHVADAVLAMAELPLSANILFQTIMATKMPYVGGADPPIHLSPNTAAGGAFFLRYRFGARCPWFGAHPLRYRNTAEASQPAAIAMASDRMP